MQEQRALEYAGCGHAHPCAEGHDVSLLAGVANHHHRQVGGVEVEVVECRLVKHTEAVAVASLQSGLACP